MARTTTPRKTSTKRTAKTEAVRSAVKETEKVLQKVAARPGDTLERYEEVVAPSLKSSPLVINPAMKSLIPMMGTPAPPTAPTLATGFEPFAKLATNVKGGGEFALGP